MLRGEVGAAPPFNEVDVGGVRLAYNDEGYGPAVVCLHAIGHGARDYAELRLRLRDRFRVIALDWPGQGQSGPDRAPASVARYAELLRLFLIAIRVERAVLIGNSIGGGAAIRYAFDQPHHVRGLVLANPAGLDPRDRLSGWAIAAMVRLFAGGSRGAGWFPFAFAQYYKLVLSGGFAERQRARIVASAAEIAPVLQQAWESFAAPESDLRALAPNIHCPVLFAWAMRDRFVQLTRNLPAIRSFPSATLETFLAGHAPHLETPAAFEKAVERFLSELP